MLTTEQIEDIKQTAEHNNGKCDKCHQVIKIYRYKINRTHALFLRAMAQKVAETGVNNVDLATIGLAYSARSQVTKLRFHGLIARIKNNEGAQVARHWLITHKGYDFLNGNQIDEKVVVYNNTVLGHEGNKVNIYRVLDEPFDPDDPIYEEAPVSEPEARAYNDVRSNPLPVLYRAIYRGSKYGSLKVGETYTLLLSKLQVGKPIHISVEELTVPLSPYKDIAEFQKNWKVL